MEVREQFLHDNVLYFMLTTESQCWETKLGSLLIFFSFCLGHLSFSLSGCSCKLFGLLLFLLSFPFSSPSHFSFFPSLFILLPLPPSAPLSSSYVSPTTFPSPIPPPEKILSLSRETCISKPMVRQ